MLDAIVIHVPAVASASLIEILWTLCGLLGLAVVCPNLWEAIERLADVTEADRRNQKAATVIRLGHVRRELLRAGKLVCLVLTGAIVMSQAAPLGQNVVTPTGLVITVLFFVIGAESALQSWLDRRDRKLIRVAIAEDLSRL